MLAVAKIQEVPMLSERFTISRRVDNTTMSSIINRLSKKVFSGTYQIM
jgi:hypothetical protein